MALDRRLCNRISNCLFLATILLSMIVPVVFLHHHRLAVILAIWSLLWLGFLVYLFIGHPTVIRVLGDDGRQRVITNAAITAVFHPHWMRVRLPSIPLEHRYLYQREERPAVR